MFADTDDNPALPSLVELPVRVKHRRPDRPVVAGQMRAASFKDVWRSLADRLIKVGANARDRWSAKRQESAGAEQGHRAHADEGLDPPAEQGGHGDGGQYRQGSVKHHE